MASETARQKPSLRTKPVKKKSSLKNKPSKKTSATSKTSQKKPSLKSKLAKKPSLRSKPAQQQISKTKKTPKKAVKKKLGNSRVRTVSTLTLDENQMLDAPVLSSARISGDSAQSGDLQGLTGVEGADSETVGELLEEGNAFEAGVVLGVEDADDADAQPVRTHQVPEDDVPGEYLDND